MHYYEVGGPNESSFEYYRAHLGDTEVGAVFDHGGIEPLIENSDGDCVSTKSNSDEYTELCCFIENIKVFQLEPLVIWSHW